MGKAFESSLDGAIISTKTTNTKNRFRNTSITISMNIGLID